MYFVTLKKKHSLDIFVFSNNSVAWKFPAYIKLIIDTCSQLKIMQFQYHCHSCSYWSHRHPTGRHGIHGDGVDLSWTAP